MFGWGNSFAEQVPGVVGVKLSLINLDRTGVELFVGVQLSTHS